MVDLSEKADVGRRLEEAMAGGSARNSEIAELTGVTLQAVGGWIKTGRIARKHLPIICDRLGITMDWLLTGREPKHPIRISEVPGIYSTDPERRRIPVINYIQAGHPREIIDDYSAGDGFDTVGVDPDTARQLGKHAFALVVDGDSMLPDFRPGDLVVVDPDASVRPGDIVVAKLERDQAATLKKYRSRGTDQAGSPVFELVPLNDNYPTLLVSSSNPGQVIGPVIEHRRKMR